jgi:hypothetical protein
LNNYGPDGWEVCAVAIVPAFFSDELYEIFYLKRKVATP